MNARAPNPQRPIKEGLVSGPEDSPYVRDDLMGQVVHATWNIGEEASLIAVLEAHRRFLAQTDDSRTAAALTLAWATHYARPE
jgi:hypothetical protein